MALTARLDNLDYNTYVLMGDGEIAEGAVWEAASLAGVYKLNNLIALVDVNRLGQSQATEFGHDIGVYRKRFEAFGWRVEDVDGHDIEEILEVLSGVGLNDQPLCIIAKTYKGAGVSFLQDKEGWHGRPLNQEEAAKAIAELQPSAKSGIGVPIPAPAQLPAPNNAAPAGYPPINYKPGDLVGLCFRPGFVPDVPAKHDQHESTQREKRYQSAQLHHPRHDERVLVRLRIVVVAVSQYVIQIGRAHV